LLIPRALNLQALNIKTGDKVKALMNFLFDIFIKNNLNF